MGHLYWEICIFQKIREQFGFSWYDPFKLYWHIGSLTQVYVFFNIKSPLSASLDPSCVYLWCMGKFSLWGVQWTLRQQICQFLRGRQLFFITHFFWTSTVEPQPFSPNTADAIDCLFPLSPTCIHLSSVSCYCFCPLKLVISLYSLF